MSIEAMKRALEALEEIALAGMSGTGQESEEGMRDWHARQAWKFIGIAARALDPLRTAIQQAESEPAAFNGWYCAHCQRGVDASEVTYHEQHTVCGRVISDDVPPPTNPAPGVPDADFDLICNAIQQAEAKTDERAAFEAEMRCECVWGHRSLKKRPDGRYQNWQVDLMWDVWKARAQVHPAQAGVTDDVVRDAQRYRWLRDFDHWPAPFASSQESEPVRGADLDAAIDAAMQKGGE